MSDLTTYGLDGACPAARVVLAYIQDRAEEILEPSWSDEFKRYTMRLEIGRWENCREQGYVVRARDKSNRHQLNIAWFEHRNSDEICAIEWEQATLNSPTIETADFGGQVYCDKYDVSHTVAWDKASSMAEWISNEFKSHWLIAESGSA